MPGFYEIDPLEDLRWKRLIECHPRSSVYHTTAWLEALRQTYGYRAVAFTTCAPDAELRNAIVFCRVESWLTGRRLVSLPFSDHCDPLFDPAESGQPDLVAALRMRMEQEGWQYVEMRPTHPIDSLGEAQAGLSYSHHQLDLTPDMETLFGNCHKNSTQRKVRRAEREGLIYEEGRTAILMDRFYDLMVVTRRRHGTPPQPKMWFQRLISSFGEHLKIRVALKGTTPVAAILTLRHKKALVYKYGCSDERFHNLGGMHLLMWKSICEAKQDGLRIFDFGRSDSNNPGLITFKDRWGAERSPLTYVRLLGQPDPKRGVAFDDARLIRMANWACKRLPAPLFRALGEIGYKHIG